MDVTLMKIGLLSTLNHPMLPHYLMALHKEGFTEIKVLCDLNSLSEKDLSIIEERTLGRFNKIGNEDAFTHSSSITKASFIFVKNHNSPESFELINNLKLDCLVNAGTPRKLGKKILGATPIGVINIHPGELPKYRGCSSVEWSLYNNDNIANTVHLMDEEYDAGPILTIETYERSQFDSYQDLRCHLYKKACELLPKALKGFESGQYTLENQDEDAASSWKPIDSEKFAEVKGSFPEAKRPLEYN